jgi:GNAT superfamily N-acetyltransferase
MDDFARRALAVSQAWFGFGNERFEADGATFMRNRAIPAIRDANHVTEITASTPEEVERLFARVEREFAGIPHRGFVVDFTTAPAVEARLLAEDYRCDGVLLLALDGDLRTRARDCDIRRVDDDAGWAAHKVLSKLNWTEGRERHNAPQDVPLADMWAASQRSKSPPFTYWLAYVDGEARACLSSWGGEDGIGEVEDLFTHPDFRHRGLATALMHHCVADCRARGAREVILGCDPGDTPKQMYAAMGFRPFAMKRAYWKNVG